MEEFVVYVLWSRKHGKTYCGQTGNVIARFLDHNKLGNKGWVKNFRPWEVVHVEFYGSRKEALAREKFFKTGKGREWIQLHILK